MFLATLALVLGCSLCWAGLDVVRKLLLSAVRPFALAFWLTVGQLPPLVLWVVLEGSFRVEPGYVLPASISVLLNILAFTLFLHAIHVSPLSVTIPLLSLTPVFAGLLGVPLLGERPALVQDLGMALIVFGAFALNGALGDLKRPWRLCGSLLRERGSFCMVLVALFWGATGLFDKLALSHAHVSTHALILTSGVAVCLLPWLWVTGRFATLGAIRNVPRLYPLGVALGVVALALQFMAFQVTLVSLVEAVKRAVGMTSAVVAGRLLLNEPVTPMKVTSVGAMVTGIGLLLLT